jgi:hypothetical protein
MCDESPLAASLTSDDPHRMGELGSDLTGPGHEDRVPVGPRRDPHLLPVDGPRPVIPQEDPDHRMFGNPLAGIIG